MATHRITYFSIPSIGAPWAFFRGMLPSSFVTGTWRCQRIARELHDNTWIGIA